MKDKKTISSLQWQLKDANFRVIITSINSEVKRELLFFIIEFNFNVCYKL